MTDPRRSLEAYLDVLRARLRALPPGEAEDIVREIASHVRDSIEAAAAPNDAAVAAALGRLGPPEALADSYLTEILLARAGESRSPWPVLRGFLHWATVSAAGIVPLLGVVLGYVAAVSLFVAALVKPFAPDRVGLFRLADGEISLRLGLSGGPPPSGNELLGWWITPIGLLCAGAAYSMTALVARLFVRRFRRNRVPPLGGRGRGF